MSSGTERGDAPAWRPRRERDVRLDFFRGLAMFIIFIAHMPDNTWFDWIPARFGFSSAAELFVFCSGLASSYAFGTLFVSQGFVLGTARVAFRMWQVYWSHIGLALIMIAASVIGRLLTGVPYDERLGLAWFFANPGEGFVRLLTLTFTPNFLDILPMYLILLAMIPVVVALGQRSPRALLAVMVATWLLIQLTEINLPGGTAPGMSWFFNPLAWQIVFFTGFALGMGWVPTPRFRRGLLFYVCVAVLVVSVPINFWGFTDYVPALDAIRMMIEPYTVKTHQPALLFLHFLASAYVALTLVDPIRGQLARFLPIIQVGQQALAAFMASLVLAWTGGMLLDHIGRGFFQVAAVNVVGIVLIFVAARTARFFKSHPWSKPVGKPAGGPDLGPVAAAASRQPAEAG